MVVFAQKQFLYKINTDALSFVRIDMILNELIGCDAVEFDLSQ